MSIIYFNNVFIYIHICDCANDIWQTLKFIISIKASKKKKNRNHIFISISNKIRLNKFKYKVIGTKKNETNFMLDDLI